MNFTSDENFASTETLKQHQMQQIDLNDTTRPQRDNKGPQFQVLIDEVLQHPDI